MQHDKSLLPATKYRGDNCTSFRDEYRYPARTFRGRLFTPPPRLHVIFNTIVFRILKIIPRKKEKAREREGERNEQVCQTFISLSLFFY